MSHKKLLRHEKIMNDIYNASGSRLAAECTEKVIGAAWRVSRA